MGKPAPSYKSEGWNDVTMMMTFPDKKCAEALKLYEKVFDAKVVEEPTIMNGKIAHSVIKIGDTQLMCNDFFGGGPEADDGPTPNSAYVYVPDVDATFATAAENEFSTQSSPNDMFWGDRMAFVKDPYGHRWMIVTAKTIPSEEEIEKGQKEMEAHCA